MFLAFLFKVLAWLTSLGMSIAPVGTPLYEGSSMAAGWVEVGQEQAMTRDSLPASAQRISDDDKALAALQGTWASPRLQFSMTVTGTTVDVDTACNAGVGEMTVRGGVLDTDLIMQMMACGGRNNAAQGAALSFLMGSHVYVDGDDVWLEKGGKALKLVPR